MQNLSLILVITALIMCSIDAILYIADRFKKKRCDVGLLDKKRSKKYEYK
jgi:hypothetical protein